MPSVTKCLSMYSEEEVVEIVEVPVPEEVVEIVEVPVPEEASLEAIEVSPPLPR